LSSSEHKGEDMKELLRHWLELKNEERILKEKREEIEIELYTMIHSELPADGSKTIHADEYKLVVKPNFAVKVNQDMAAEYAQYFKNEYKMSYPTYRDLDAGAKKYVDEIVTITTNKPTFSVEMK
jgi:hypothetical protein